MKARSLKTFNHFLRSGIDKLYWFLSFLTPDRDVASWPELWPLLPESVAVMSRPISTLSGGSQPRPFSNP